MPEAQAVGVMEKLVSEIRSSTDSEQLSVLGEGLKAVLGKVPKAETAGVVEKLVEAIMVEGLAALPERLWEAEATMVVEKLLSTGSSTEFFYGGAPARIRHNGV